jgi:AbrB family looped-hinge helix DNA binding protein
MCMEITKVSDEGQVIIPEELLKLYGWQIGQELMIIEMGDGILIKPKKTLLETTLDDVAGCLKYQGTPKTLEDMDDAIRQGVEESWNGRS